jgi:hypothetical protein
MQLQCRCCRSLALCNPEQILSVDQPTFIRLEKILRGRDLGCIGCRLVCECLPLLNDYYTGSGEPCGLFVHAGIIEPNDSRSEAFWCLAFREFVKGNEWNWIGEFELCKTTSKQDSWLDVEVTFIDSCSILQTSRFLGRVCRMRYRHPHTKFHSQRVKKHTIG